MQSVPFISGSIVFLFPPLESSRKASSHVTKQNIKHSVLFIYAARSSYRFAHAHSNLWFMSEKFFRFTWRKRVYRTTNINHAKGVESILFVSFSSFLTIFAILFLFFLLFTKRKRENIFARKVEAVDLLTHIYEAVPFLRLEYHKTCRQTMKSVQTQCKVRAGAVPEFYYLSIEMLIDSFFKYHT